MEATLRGIQNISWRQHPTKAELYRLIHYISTILREGRMSFTGHSWGADQGTASDLLLRTPSFEASQVGNPTITYTGQSNLTI